MRVRSSCVRNPMKIGKRLQTIDVMCEASGYPSIIGTTSVGLGHLSLIYALCVNIGVKGDPSEEKFFFILALTKRKIVRFVKVDIEEVGHTEPHLTSRSNNGSSRSSQTSKS
ncbi:hypothetical protein IEQ34_013507 [Dendrobium chrysotoxum]|uniref:Uncharacterized protein n=1 Tax=Dendrobium chrysotoxum TaxID=161865 RepID=A0AAV7GRK3_DENCH|nr:hypothetical protein IEQ34_013507 [Dendrobium chrysotoxum]